MCVMFTVESSKRRVDQNEKESGPPEENPTGEKWKTVKINRTYGIYDKLMLLVNVFC